MKAATLGSNKMKRCIFVATISDKLSDLYRLAWSSAEPCEGCANSVALTLLELNESTYQSAHLQFLEYLEFSYISVNKD